VRTSEKPLASTSTRHIISANIATKIPREKKKDIEGIYCRNKSLQILLFLSINQKKKDRLRKERTGGKKRSKSEIRKNSSQGVDSKNRQQTDRIHHRGPFEEQMASVLHT